MGMDSVYRALGCNGCRASPRSEPVLQGTETRAIRITAAKAIHTSAYIVRYAAAQLRIDRDYW